MTAALSYRSRALTALAVALPVPLLAALGLSLPLPGTVARLAARLVPFADRSVLAAGAETPARGRIVTRPHESALVRVRVRDASGATRVVSVPRAALGNDGAPRTRGGVIVAREPSDASPVPVVSPGPSAPTPSAGHATNPAEPQAGATAQAPPPPTSATTPTTPAPAPTPTPGEVVNTVTTAVDQTVSSVPKTVTTVTDTAKNTVTTATSVVGGILGSHP
jgi:hypothetical protein